MWLGVPYVKCVEYDEETGMIISGGWGCHFS